MFYFSRRRGPTKQTILCKQQQDPILSIGTLTDNSQSSPKKDSRDSFKDEIVKTEVSGGVLTSVDGIYPQGDECDLEKTTDSIEQGGSSMNLLDIVNGNVSHKGHLDSAQHLISSNLTIEKCSSIECLESLEWQYPLHGWHDRHHIEYNPWECGPNSFMGEVRKGSILGYSMEFDLHRLNDNWASDKMREVDLESELGKVRFGGSDYNSGKNESCTSTVSNTGFKELHSISQRRFVP